MLDYDVFAKDFYESLKQKIRRRKKEIKRVKSRNKKRINNA